MFFPGTEQDVFIHGDAEDAVLVDGEFAGAGEAVQLAGIDLDAADLVVGNLAGIDLVIEVVLALDPDGAGLELHVDVLGDKDDGRAVVLHEQQAGGKDAVIHAFAVWKNAVEAVELFRVGRAACGIVDHEPDGAAALGGDAVGDLLRAGKHLGKPAVDAAGIRPALGLLGLESVELGQDVYQDAEVVFLESFKSGGVVQEDVGVQHIVFRELGRGRKAEIRRLGRVCSGPFFPDYASGFGNFFKQGGLTFLGTMDHR